MTVVLIVVILLFLFYASYSIKSQVYVKTLCRIDTSEKIVYLTFDDGVDAHQTPLVLDVLRHNNIKAAFFVIGEKIAGNEDLLKQMADEGHLIGNHSFSHNNFFPLHSKKWIIADIEKCRVAIEQAIGRSTTFFRPPFGVTNPAIGGAVRRLKLKTIGWSIRTYDTIDLTTEHIVDSVRRKLKPGTIILLHDRLPNSDTTLLAIIDMLKEENYCIGNLLTDY